MGVSALRKGYAGDSRLMPSKAFAVASLFVGASASAAMASLRLSGIRCDIKMAILRNFILSRLQCITPSGRPQGFRHKYKDWARGTPSGT